MTGVFFSSINCHKMCKVTASDSNTFFQIGYLQVDSELTQTQAHTQTGRRHNTNCNFSLSEELEIISGQGNASSLSPTCTLLHEVINSWRYFMIYLVICVLGRLLAWLVTWTFAICTKYLRVLFLIGNKKFKRITKHNQI